MKSEVLLMIRCCKFVLIFLFLIFTSSLYSAEPTVKFYHIDGSTKEYKLNEIDSLSVIDKKNNYVLRIHYDDSLVAYYPTEINRSIKFENDSLKRMMLNVYIFSYPKPHKISSIDSLIFYIDQWQPLTIGTQVWMLKNLNVDHYQNGNPIPEVTDARVWDTLNTGAWCYYENDPANGAKYGKLYNWYAVNDPRGLAPAGWHVPTNAEWTELENCLGGSSVAGGKLKSKGTKSAGSGLWGMPNTGASNTSGFSALPGGYRYNGGTFNSIELNGYWWSATESSSTYAWDRYLSYYYSDINRGSNLKGYGFSVRCLRD